MQQPSQTVLWQISVFLFWIFMIFALMDIFRSKFEGNRKLIWVILSILVPFGGLIYFIWGRKTKTLKD